MLTKNKRDSIRATMLEFVGEKEIFILDLFSENYEVSNLGRVRNVHTGKILKPIKNNHGYYVVKLYENGEPKTTSIHRIVARSFLNSIDYEINHIDANKANNSLTNLELVTRQENLAHAKSAGLYRGLKGEDSPSFKFSTELVDEMIEFKKLGFKLREIAKSYNTSTSYVCTMLKQRIGGLR